MNVIATDVTGMHLTAVDAAAMDAMDSLECMTLQTDAAAIDVTAIDCT